MVTRQVLIHVIYYLSALVVAVVATLEVVEELEECVLILLCPSLQVLILLPSVAVVVLPVQVVTEE
jgi:hypothetical protein